MAGIDGPPALVSEKPKIFAAILGGNRNDMHGVDAAIIMNPRTCRLWPRLLFRPFG